MTRARTMGTVGSVVTKPGVLVATAMLVAVGSGARVAAPQGGTVTIETGTGEYADCLRKAFYEPFEKATGIKILTSPESHNVSKYKLQVETRHYTTDVGGITSDYAQPPHGPQYLEQIDYSVVTNKNEIIPELAQTYAVATDTYAYTLGYNTEKTGGKTPTGWADFFDLQKFPGKRGVGDDATRILIMALLADGVAPSGIVPLDFDRAFRKLNTIKPQLVYWQTGSQVQDLLVSGETPLAITFANRVASSRASGKPLAQVWKGAMIGSDMLAVPKGNPNKATAMRYVAFVLRKDINGRLSDCIALGPSNLQATANPKWANDFPTSHMNEPHVVLDSPAVASWLSSHADEIQNRFNQWKSQ
jgi:putative spermidine/putrescine transport system substrate-binding protein